MTQVIISSLPPLPNVTGSGVPKGTDLSPATDITDTTEASTGTTKKYTRAAEFNFNLTAQGFLTIDATKGATVGNLTATYDNGTLGVGATLTNSGTQATFSVDGVSFSVGDRVLVKNQISTFQNGIYVISNVGSISTNWVLTRATDYDQAADIIEDQVILVNLGTNNGGLAFQQASPGLFVIGTSPITFKPMSQNNANNFTWFDITDTTIEMTANNGYIANNASQVNLTLPTTSNEGDILNIVGKGVGGFIITQGNNQQIHVSPQSTTLGVTGSLASTAQYQSIELVCIEENTVWTAKTGPQGNFTYI
jgi:hypothetical protein